MVASTPGPGSSVGGQEEDNGADQRTGRYLDYILLINKPTDDGQAGEKDVIHPLAVIKTLHVGKAHMVQSLEKQVREEHGSQGQ